MISTPTIAHSTTPLFNDKMFRHTALLVITVQETSNLSTTNTEAQDKQIFRILYEDLYRELAEIRAQFHLDPTAALARFDMLQLQIQNAIY